MCIDNGEEDKYLMTFQNFLSRIPKWNAEIVGTEVEKIKETSGCDYLEDLITCVHVIQLKALTCIRVGMEHRAIDIEIPKLDSFIALPPMAQQPTVADATSELALGIHDILGEGEELDVIVHVNIPPDES